MTEHVFDPDWEHVNADLRRLKIPGGWLAITTVKIIVGGKDYHVTSQPIKIDDPYYAWIIPSKL